MKKSILMVLAFAAAALFIAGCEPQATGNNTTNPNETVYCTEDAKLCPDGSYVGREGPNCEFAACPESGIETPEGAFIVESKVIGESAEQCATIRFTCEAGYEYFSTDSTCGCVQFGYDVEFKGNDIACTREYMPVCAWYDQSVQCFAYPCAVTVGNKCEAQTVENVDYYTAGECPLPGEGVPGKVGEDTLIEFSYSPVQCETTPWQEWLAVAQFEAGKVPEGEALIAAYYASKGVQVEDVQRVESGAATCQACYECPAGYSLKLKARAGDKLALSEDGWTSGENPDAAGGIRLTDRVECTEPRPEGCTMDYNPVCADNGETYGNGCSACGDTDVDSYVPGECGSQKEREYKSVDPEQCKAMLFTCEQGWKPFFDESGCGCEEQ